MDYGTYQSIQHLSERIATIEARQEIIADKLDINWNEEAEQLRQQEVNEG